MELNVVEQYHFVEYLTNFFYWFRKPVTDDITLQSICYRLLLDALSIFLCSPCH